MNVMSKTIQAILAAKAAKKAEAEAVACRIERVVYGAIERTDQAVQELNALQYQITRLPTPGNTSANAERIKADGYRLWFAWIGRSLVALTDHGELLGTYNKRPITKIGEQPQAHLSYEDVVEWAQDIYERDGSFTPCNGEGLPICQVLDNGTFRLHMPGVADVDAKCDVDRVMQRAAEWLAGIIDPESFKAPDA